MIRYFAAVAATIFCTGASLAHDANGLKSMDEAISKLPPNVQKILQSREALRQPGAVNTTIREAVKLDDNRPTPAGAPGESADAGFTNLDNTLEQVFEAKARWAHRQTLRYCFMDGSDAARRKFGQIFADVLTNTNLRTIQTTANCGQQFAEIRVSFSGGGYWSYVGNDAVLIPQSRPTLNLSGMGQSGNWSPTWVGIAIHEIGHALAMQHEHQHPDVDCQFKPVEQLAALMGWTPEQVKTNMGRLMNRSKLIITKRDPESVMHYKLSADYFTTGDRSPCFITSKNNKLSKGDIEALRVVYPSRGP